jgi:predicted transposase YbfD/YdcC
MDSSRRLVVDELADEPCIVDLWPLFRRFKQITDLRQPKGKRYPLPVLLSIAVLAKLAGQQQPQAIADWARLRVHPLCWLFGLGRHAMPVLRTWGRVFGQGLVADELEEIVCDFLHGAFYGPPPEGSVCAAIDGKTLRGTIRTDAPQGVHLLAIYLPRDGIVLAQMEIASKESEISAASQLLRHVELKGLVITGDAMFTQRKLSLQIVAAGGDYLWDVKGNQAALQEDIATLFEETEGHGERGAASPECVAGPVVSKGHGRLERRTLICSDRLNGYSSFPHMAQVFKLETHVTDLATLEETTHVRYGVTSLSAQRATAQELLALVRQHWGIESGLHYRRDVTLGEDRIHTCTGQAPHIHAILNNLIVGLLNHHKPDNMARGVREMTYQIERLMFRRCCT